MRAEAVEGEHEGEAAPQIQGIAHEKMYVRVARTVCRSDHDVDTAEAVAADSQMSIGHKLPSNGKTLIVFKA